MRRLLLFLLPFFLLFSSNVYAQSALPGTSLPDAPQGIMIAPPIIQNPPFLGQDHFYSVQLRGNGEAVVNLKTIFSNLQETELTNVTLLAPKGVRIENLLAYQILREPQCIRYRTPSITPYPGAMEKEMYRVPTICEEYGQPDYFNYDYSSTKYQKALSMNENDTITISLPQPVASNGAGSLIIYFTSPSYAKKNAFGAFDYIFGSLRVEDKIRTLQVGVSVDSDWYLKGVSGKVQYSLSESALSFKDSALSKPAMNPQFMNYYQEVGQGALVKNASNLQPLDCQVPRFSRTLSKTFCLN